MRAPPPIRYIVDCDVPRGEEPPEEEPLEPLPADVPPEEPPFVLALFSPAATVANGVTFLEFRTLAGVPPPPIMTFEA